MTYTWRISTDKDTGRLDPAGQYTGVLSTMTVRLDATEKVADTEQRKFHV